MSYVCQIHGWGHMFQPCSICHGGSTVSDKVTVNYGPVQATTAASEFVSIEKYNDLQARYDACMEENRKRGNALNYSEKCEERIQNELIFANKQINDLMDEVATLKEGKIK